MLRDKLDHAAPLSMVDGFIDLLERRGLDELVTPQPTIAKNADHSRDSSYELAFTLAEQ
jgi:hypothetical protein